MTAGARRLDAELVRRGLARSRRHGVELVAARAVTVDDAVASKPSQPVLPDARIDVSVPEDLSYVGRGGVKLSGALDVFRHVEVAGAICLDAGASTGGFTEVLLRRGAAHVHAYDVGTGQLVPELASDPRVTNAERTNVRSLTADSLDPKPTLVVADVSFISLTLILPALRDVAADTADWVVMIKPQFEVGRGRLGSGGVVRDSHARAEAIERVVATARDLSMHPVGVHPSPLPGPGGNIEYFVALRTADAYGRGMEPQPDLPEPDAVTAMISAAIAAGPRERRT